MDTPKNCLGKCIHSEETPPHNFTIQTRKSPQISPAINGVIQFTRRKKKTELHARASIRTRTKKVRGRTRRASCACGGTGKSKRGSSRDFYHYAPSTKFHWHIASGELFLTDRAAFFEFALYLCAEQYSYCSLARQKAGRGRVSVHECDWILSGAMVLPGLATLWMR